MEIQFLTFDDVMKQTEKSRRYLLLGNGFSMAYKKERFSFKNLLESATEGEEPLIKKNSPIYKLFLEFGTSDFEKIVRLLESSSQVLKYYNEDSNSTQTTMTSDAKSLKKHLVKVITNNHPELPTEILEEEYLSCINFIKKFDTIFTLNYDLLLFWTTMRYKELKDNDFFKNDSEARLNISDGFGNIGTETQKDYVVFKNDNSNYYQTIHYLHGALHIFDNKHEIIKNTYSRTQKALKEQTLENLEKSIYPIFISEGTTNQKLAKIIHNSYLNSSYKTLKTIPEKYKNKSTTQQTTLIIFGTMLKNNDEHIIDAIVKSQIQTIYIGLKSLSKISDFAYLESRLDGKRELKYYDYTTINIWREI